MVQYRCRGLVTAALSATVLLLAACGQSAAEPDSEGDGDQLDPDTLVIGAVPAEEATGLQQSYDPIIEMLADETGKDVEFESATDYAAVIEAQRSGQIHIAQYGPFAYYLAEQGGADVNVAGVMIQEEGEPPGYVSYGLAPADSDIEELADFADREVCFVDANSASGYMYPLAGLIEAGLDEGDYEEVMAGGHDASAISVASGDCDAGFAFDSMVDEVLIEGGDLEEGELKVVWESETITSAPMVVHGGLDDELYTTVMDAFAEKANVEYLSANGYCPSEEDCDLSDQAIWGWEPVPDDFFDGLEEVCETTGAPQCEDPEAG
ncbi:phosphate/phosphite/phosphonate ABC transporter substrate-binding protein [Lipingzhangella sp. LS1_29]|uniref:Phosphate/phosphite/phosphonate ABC transporter substrate-binding protein n=1 Tax=Lipingzhangella rawalii TaxID=2055835 RepID=A0ABU2H7P9_9ACTN|nr:phosphate/phosphite/phosphonate ABC transporter substrate-binding protein [Lipingzhangella rawalii]MDS1271333.1 phosphate/phosphite/phosphonate ABC transporter substrate-binding protein [Lipingzhangella rawalii]